MTTLQRRAPRNPRHSAGHRTPPWLPVAELAASVVVLALVVLVMALRGGPSESTENRPGADRPSAGATTDRSVRADGSEPVIEIRQPPDVVEPMTPVPMAGTVRGVAPGSSLVVQASTDGESWTAFPLQPVVDRDGRFRTFVELGDTGSHQLRVVEPRSGATSDVVVVRVR